LRRGRPGLSRSNYTAAFFGVETTLDRIASRFNSAFLRVCLLLFPLFQTPNHQHCAHFDFASYDRFTRSVTIDCTMSGSPFCTTCEDADTNIKISRMYQRFVEAVQVMFTSVTLASAVTVDVMAGQPM
jgi:hypothetical protein